LKDRNTEHCCDRLASSCRCSAPSFVRLFIFLSIVIFVSRTASFAQNQPAAETAPQPTLPEAPQPQSPTQLPAPAAVPCPTPTHAANSAQVTQPALASPSQTIPAPCKPVKPINWYFRFIDGPQVKPLTPKEKGWLAVRNVVDPFNALTIFGDAAISVGSDPDSPYGPGMPGFARYLGVSYTQDITGEFFGAFLIPSLVHQDPHYHRMPSAKIPRRMAHAALQVLWTQGDNGKGILNYANLAGFAIDDEIGNLYVPGRSTNLPSSAARYGTGLATAPIDNFVSEFLPDVARHIHIQIVVIQRIINQVAKTDGTTSP
jgi:hypothetical protein